MISMAHEGGGAGTRASGGRVAARRRQVLLRRPPSFGPVRRSHADDASARGPGLWRERDARRRARSLWLGFAAALRDEPARERPTPTPHAASFRPPSLWPQGLGQRACASSLVGTTSSSYAVVFLQRTLHRWPAGRGGW